MFRQLNHELPAIRYKAAELDGKLSALKSLASKAKTQEAKQLASHRCPPGTTGGLANTFRPIVNAFFRSYGDTKIKVKAFRIAGARLQTQPYGGLVHVESVPAISCVEKNTPVETYCQSFNLSLRRKKYRQGPWSEWEVWIGSAQRLLCKNAR